MHLHKKINLDSNSFSGINCCYHISFEVITFPRTFSFPKTSHLWSVGKILVLQKYDSWSRIPAGYKYTYFTSLSDHEYIACRSIHTQTHFTMVINPEVETYLEDGSRRESSGTRTTTTTPSPYTRQYHLGALTKLTAAISSSQCINPVYLIRGLDMDTNAYLPIR